LTEIYLEMLNNPDAVKLRILEKGIESNLDRFISNTLTN